MADDASARHYSQRSGVSTIRPNAKKKKRARVSPGGRSRERLLDIAERLLAERGIGGASMRQIAAEAGQANNSAIQYHFGTKAGLLREIILRRVAGFEPQRQRLLDSATSKRKLSDLRTMLEIIFRPIAECTNSRGRHIYARFIMQFLNSMQFHVETEHPGWAPDSAATRAALRIAACLPFLDAHRLTARINMIGGMFYNALIERDNMMKSGRPVEPEAVFLDDLFEIMTAAMMVPVKIGPKPRQLRGAK